jgi:hypothetical protein
LNGAVGLLRAELGSALGRAPRQQLDTPWLPHWPGGAAVGAIASIAKHRYSEDLCCSFISNCASLMINAIWQATTDNS